MEYQGTLSSVDSYMNVHMERAEEFMDGQFAGFLGEVLIRCNNVLYIKAAPPPDDDDEAGDGPKKAENMEE
jgi:small nuclear ribonucleoprotein F